MPDTLKYKVLGIGQHICPAPTFLGHGHCLPGTYIYYVYIFGNRASPMYGYSHPKVWGD
nr:MAG TPA: hypothetical protein [Caudoviricetes sp.]